MLRLSAALATAALGLALLPSVASAAPTILTVSPLVGGITYDGHLPVSVTYVCSGLVDGTGLDDAVVLSVGVFEVTGSDQDGYPRAGGTVAAVCDGTSQTADVPLLSGSGTSGDEIITGPATFEASLHDPTFEHQYGSTYVQQITVSTDEPAPTPDPTPIVTPTPDPTPIVTPTPDPTPIVTPTPDPTPIVTPTPEPTPTATPTPTPPPAPVKASSSLTTDASPETVIKGKKITVKGSIERDGKKYKASTALEFAADGDSFHRVKTVKSSSKGALKATVTATKSGSFRYTFAGNSTTKSGTSASDHLVVKAKPKAKPKPKAYKNCTALVKVYPHGVGKSGAKDKGGDVTDFTRDSKTYAKNKKSDRDKDGIACER